MTFLYKSKEGVVNLAGLVISANTGVELDERMPELDAQVGKTLNRSEIDYSPLAESVVMEEPEEILAIEEVPEAVPAE